MRPVALIDRAFQSNVRAILQAVGAHDRSSHHALGDFREQLADARANQVECLRQAGLHREDDHQQRDDQEHDRDRELPGVREHEAQAADHERERDDPGDRAPLGEMRERVDVGRHARNEDAPLLLGLFGDREPVDVLERPDAKGHQRLL